MPSPSTNIQLMAAILKDLSKELEDKGLPASTPVDIVVPMAIAVFNACQSDRDGLYSYLGKQNG